MTQRAHIFVSGRVQGVFYRQETKSTAQAFGLTGWVRNLPDERVEAVFEGDPAAIKKMLQWSQIGPENARVDGFEVKWDESVEGLKEFSIRY